MMRRFDSIIFSPEDFDKHVQEFIIHLKERKGLGVQGATDAYVLFYDSQACPDGENFYLLENNRISRKKVSLDGIEVSAPVHFPDVSQTIHPVFQTNELRDKIKEGSLLTLPLIINDGEPFGVAFIYSSTAHAFTDDSIDCFAKIVCKHALSLQNTLVLASSLPYIQSFQRIRQNTNSIFYAGDICHLLLQEITRLLPAGLCCIWLKNKEQNDLKLKTANITATDLEALAPLLEDACRRTVAKDGHPRTNSITINEYICDRNGIALDKPLRVNSLLAIPIFDSDDLVAGVVEIYSEETIFSVSTISILTNWINEIFAKFGNGILASRSQSVYQQEQETITLDLGEAAKYLSKREILSRTRQTIQRLLDIDDLFIMEYNPKTDELKYIESTDPQLTETPTVQARNMGIAGYVARSKFSEYIPNISKDKRWADYPDDSLKKREKEILGHSALCAPLIADGQLLGVIFTTTPKGGRFTTDDHDALNQIASEVTYLIKAKIELVEREQALQDILQMEKIAMVGQMAGGILHDIRTPLTYIGAAAGNIQKVVNLIETNNEQLHDLIKNIKEEATDINRIRRDIEKTIAGLERKQSEPKFDKTPLDIKAFISNAFLLVKAVMKEDKSDVQLDLVEEGINTIRAATLEVKYVFQNLIKNSLEAFPSNTGQIKVKIRQRVLKDRDYVQIIFEDNAGGMLPEKFEQLKIALLSHFLFESEKKGGVGIGLKRSKDIVERQGGILELKNVPGKGFIVTILLPYD